MKCYRLETPMGILQVTVARSFWARLRGLLGRKSLTVGEALLLSPCHGIHTWGMRFAIDVVFLSVSGEVLASHARVAPWQFRRGPKGTFMTLELAAGSTETEFPEEQVWEGLCELIGRQAHE